MFKFLFRGRETAPEVKIETQRETFTRLVEELNEALEKLADKPAVTIEPATGRVSFALPEQFPDEALALPGPEAAPEPPSQNEESSEAKTEPEAEKKAET